MPLDATSPETPDPSSQSPGATSATSAPTGAASPLYCRVLLDKNQGVIIEVLDAQGMNQQSVTLDGTNLTLNVRGPSGQSTIVQTADRVAINAKDVSIDADTVRITSRAATSMQSLGMTNITSMTDITVQTPGRMSQHAMTGIDMNTLNLSVNAIQNATIQSVGGIGLFGVGGGVQLFGSTVSLTGLSTNVVGLELGLLAFDIEIGAPNGGGQGGDSQQSGQSTGGDNTGDGSNQTGDTGGQNG